MSIARLFAPMLKLFAAAMLVGSSASAEVVKLELSPVGEGDLITIRTRDARQQLIATAVHADGSLTDVTRDVTWTISDSKVLAIDSTGHRSLARHLGRALRRDEETGWRIRIGHCFSIQLACGTHRLWTVGTPG